MPDDPNDLPSALLDAWALRDEVDKFIDDESWMDDWQEDVPRE